MSSIVTYSPYTGKIYEGDVSRDDMRYADNFKMLASVNQTPIESLPQENIAGLSPIPLTASKLSIELSPEIRQTALTKLIAKQLKQKAVSGTLSPAEYMQYQNSQRLVAANNNIDNRAEYVRVIPRIPKVIGVPPSIYFVSKGAFTSQAIDKLDAKVFRTRLYRNVFTIRSW